MRADALLLHQPPREEPLQERREVGSAGFIRRPPNNAQAALPPGS